MWCRLPARVFWGGFVTSCVRVSHYVLDQAHVGYLLSIFMHHGMRYELRSEPSEGHWLKCLPTYMTRHSVTAGGEEKKTLRTWVSRHHADTSSPGFQTAGCPGYTAEALPSRGVDRTRRHVAPRPWVMGRAPGHARGSSAARWRPRGRLDTRGEASPRGERAGARVERWRGGCEALVWAARARRRSTRWMLFASSSLVWTHSLPLQIQARILIQRLLLPTWQAPVVRRGAVYTI